MATERGQLAVLVATICLFFLIFFMLPTPVGAISLCSGRGYRNGTNGLCMCAGGFHGEACEYTFCPFGESWFSKPLENNKRNLELVPCSNMGSCNPLTGNCACRDGFDGSACERTICPTTVQTVTTGNLVTENIFIEGAASSAQLAGTLDLSNTPHCSGHGVCKTMREMGAEFDGLALIRPPVSYSSWDADKFQGCLCDPGWEAYDCSRRSCPWGRDPSEGGGREERLVLQCMATEGYFALLVMGRYTDPIPFDAEPGLLKIALERNPLVGEVSVLMPALESEGGLPQVCGSNNVVSTTIIFKDQKGPMAPLLLTQNTSNTRQWPHGSTRLLLGDGLPVLRMATVHALHCVACPTCTGRVYFSYRNSISDPVDVTANGAAAAIEAALLGLPDLVSANWGMSINVTVRGTVDRICYAGTDNAIDIVFYSEYGNIPFLSLFDATQLPGDSVDSYPHNVTLSSNAAIGQSYECSRQGLCNYGSGTCTCFSASVGGQKKYRAASSDGYGAAGTIGDCGYLSREQQDCLVGGLDACNGQGFCGNSTGVCECYDGFSGITCTVRSCPRGAAWHDEPSAGDEAHAFAECSSMGLCDKLTGVCKCRPGYSGPACDIRDCERDKNSFAVCSGHGACVNTATFFSRFGLTYGNVSTDYIKPGGDNWDAYGWFHCLCAASEGFLGDPLRPSVGPQALVGGISTGSLPLPGWGNWDCSEGNCPLGHRADVLAPPGLVGAREVQAVRCGLSQTVNESEYFLLALWGANTARIGANFNADEIRAAIEYSPLIGNVTINFPQFLHDTVATACHTHVNESYGGFTVRFDTEFGDLPMFTSPYPAFGNVTIEEVVKGTITNEECGGSTMGFCARATGQCVCNTRRGSSDGTGQFPGNAGDCSYSLPDPIAKQDAYTVFNTGVADF